jgi:hypothetical protein
MSPPGKPTLGYKPEAQEHSDKFFVRRRGGKYGAIDRNITHEQVCYKRTFCSERLLGRSIEMNKAERRRFYRLDQVFLDIPDMVGHTSQSTTQEATCPSTSPWKWSAHVGEFAPTRLSAGTPLREDHGARLTGGKNNGTRIREKNRSPQEGAGQAPGRCPLRTNFPPEGKFGSI